MTSWVIAADDVDYSDMDGIGNPFVNGDDFAANAAGIIRADQNGAAGANCTVAIDGEFHIEASVQALFNSGGSWKLTSQGKIFGEGTDGNNAVIGGDAGTDADQLFNNAAGWLYANYTTFQYYSNNNSIYSLYAVMYFKNCSFSHFGISGIYSLRANMFFDTCEWLDNDCTVCIMTLSGYNLLVLKDCTMRSTTGWVQPGYGDIFYFIGNTLYSQDAGAFVEPDETNDTPGAHKEDFRYYKRLTVSEGNALAGCDVTINHTSIPDDGWRWEDTTSHTWLEPFMSFGDTDGSGDVDLYLLQKNHFDGTTKYWSDSGEAEAGDNQKFTIGLIKDGYVYNTTTVWADGATASITLAEVSTGGRQPRERRHGN